MTPDGMEEFNIMVNNRKELIMRAKHVASVKNFYILLQQGLDLKSNPFFNDPTI